jgi:hypothetical protein
VSFNAYLLPHSHAFIAAEKRDFRVMNKKKIVQRQPREKRSADFLSAIEGDIL